ncbi:hypothetical protein [Streptomyces sp. SUK 48]|uniref:hypothetical protein n=1 Tax=Streptomyces sp. SUK 48 TaxID=2582831 RepID=UPI00129B4497|nr:hypothetical protein [Streptomyces sp. SUK 48]
MVTTPSDDTTVTVRSGSVVIRRTREPTRRNTLLIGADGFGTLHGVACGSSRDTIFSAPAERSYQATA